MKKIIITHGDGIFPNVKWVKKKTQKTPKEVKIFITVLFIGCFVVTLVLYFLSWLVSSAGVEPAEVFPF